MTDPAHTDDHTLDVELTAEVLFPDEPTTPPFVLVVISDTQFVRVYSRAQLRLMLDRHGHLMTDEHRAECWERVDTCGLPATSGHTKVEVNGCGWTFAARHAAFQVTQLEGGDRQEAGAM